MKRQPLTFEAPEEAGQDNKRCVTHGAVQSLRLSHPPDLSGIFANRLETYLLPSPHTQETGLHRLQTITVLLPTLAGFP